MSSSREPSPDLTTNLQEFPSVRRLLLTLAALVTLSGVVGLFAAFTYKDTRSIIPGNEHITMGHLFNRTFAADRTTLEWVPEGVCANAFAVVTVELKRSPFEPSRRWCIFRLSRWFHQARQPRV
jgi:hypothetical protein